MPSTRWRGDCPRCAALCCLSLAFDRGEHFAFDKPAGEPCPLLGPHHACSLHALRDERGLGGCVAYDCLGAGQRVVEELFGGRSWQTDPALSRPMQEAFWRMRELQQLLLGLELTERLGLDPELTRRRQELVCRLDPPGGFDRATFDALALEAAKHDVREFLAGLRERLRRAEPARYRLPLAEPTSSARETDQPTRSASQTTTSSLRAKCASAGGPPTSSP